MVDLLYKEEVYAIIGACIEFIGTWGMVLPKLYCRKRLK
jgi:hypothetical protein